MKLGEIILNYRREHGYSQRQFAKMCGVSNSYISFLENGKNPKTGKPMKPTIEQYQTIAKVMGISEQELYNQLGDESPIDWRHVFVDTTTEYVIPDNVHDLPKNDDVRLLLRGLNKLSPDQIKQTTNVFRAMFIHTNPDLFEEGDDDK